MNKAEEICIQIPGYQIAAKSWGPNNRRKVLSVHGWLDNAASFDLLAPQMPDINLVAIDMVGHGQSSHRATGVPYHFVDFVADVVEVVNALGWDQFSFISHSLGAAVSSFTSAIIPERVQKLVLIEGLGPFSGDPDKAPEALATSIKQMSRFADKRPPIYSSLESMVEAREKVGDLTHDAARRIINRCTQSCGGGFTWTSDPRLRFTSPQYVTEEAVLAYLKSIQAPTLLINGEQGIIAQRKGIQQRYAAVQNFMIKTLTGGHHLHMERPEQVAKEIQQFLGH